MSNPEMSDLKMYNPEPSDRRDERSEEPTVSVPAEPTESFKDIFSEYEQIHSRKSGAGSQRR